MIYGIGTDLLKMNEIRSAFLQKADPFYEKTYTIGEKQQADGSASREDYLRRRFCAKEAIFKALRENPEHARLNEIEILDDETGAPRVILYGRLKERAAQNGICRVHISMSSAGEYAIAYAVAQTHERNGSVL